MGHYEKGKEERREKYLQYLPAVCENIDVSYLADEMVKKDRFNSGVLKAATF